MKSETPGPRKASKALEWIAGLAGAFPGMALGFAVIPWSFGPYPDQAMMLILLTVPLGGVIGGMIGLALIRSWLRRQS